MTSTIDNETAKIGSNEMFCPSCGNIIFKQAEICPKCGVRNSLSTNPVQPKSKTSAVLLAVFLGFWTWLYTYQKDAWKFWLNLILVIFTFGLWGFVAWVWAIVDVAIKPPKFYLDYPNFPIPNPKNL